MLPRWHVLFGAIFTAILFFFSPNISLLSLSLVFLSSVFIDLDHYIMAVKKTKKLSLFHAFNYHKKLNKEFEIKRKKGIREKGDFHLFHTVEFHALIGAVGVFFTPFFFIFIGMVFHSTLDLFWLKQTDYIYLREYFFFNWTRNHFS